MINCFRYCKSLSTYVFQKYNFIIVSDCFDMMVGDSPVTHVTLLFLLVSQKLSRSIKLPCHNCVTGESPWYDNYGKKLNNSI